MRTCVNLFLICLLCFSCSHNNDDDARSLTLNGNWNLVNVSGGLLGLDQDFEKGTVVWDFDESDKMVKITNNNQLQDVYTGPPSGTYSYSISAPADADVLLVNDINLGNINFTESTLTLDQLALDGIKMSFTR